MCHFPSPVWAAKTTRFRPSPPVTSAVISTVPVAPAAGAFRATVGLASGAGSGLPALRTTVDRAGTVTVSVVSPPVRSVPSAPVSPWRARKAVFGEPVGIFTVRAFSLLLAATRYSVRRLASMREKAYTPGPSPVAPAFSTYRSIWAPSRRAGCSRVSFDSAAMDR